MNKTIKTTIALFLFYGVIVIVNYSLYNSKLSSDDYFFLSLIFNIVHLMLFIPIMILIDTIFKIDFLKAFEDIHKEIYYTFKKLITFIFN